MATFSMSARIAVAVAVAMAGMAGGANAEHHHPAGGAPSTMIINPNVVYPAGGHVMHHGPVGEPEHHFRPYFAATPGAVVLVAPTGVPLAAAPAAGAGWPAWPVGWSTAYFSTPGHLRYHDLGHGVRGFGPRPWPRFGALGYGYAGLASTPAVCAAYLQSFKRTGRSAWLDRYHACRLGTN